MDQPLVVQAEFSFMGSNNDELCFKKGDLITVTQREDGGWWEGTLNDKTGWFPSNYVNEYNAPLPQKEVSIRAPEEIQEYRSVVLKDLLDSERAHVAELQGLFENFLEPMLQTQILNPDEYAQLMCNFVEIVRTHEDLLTQIEECKERVGKLFLTIAPLMKKVHQAYCAAHPKAIVILDKYKDELEKYMERQGAATPGLLVLTTGLSKPFRRLDKYSAMLQELERHMESSHPDRGDTQRSVAVYKDIAATCSATRRQKELELQVLTGPVRGWQGQELSSLGDIIHMGSVAVGADHRDRYFVLFPQTLLILSVSQRMSAFIYEGKLPLTGIVVNRLEDTEAIKNAFEISSSLIDRIVAVCQGPNEANKWVELLNANNPSLPMGIKRQLSNLSNSSLGGQLNASHLSQHLDSRGYCTRFSLCAYYNSNNNNNNISPTITLPPRNYPPTAPYANLSAHFACLVKAGRLRGAIVKMLLYPQARQSIDLKRIALRKKRCHKAAAKLKDLKNDTMELSNQSSELERQDAFEFPTDSESYEDEYEDGTSLRSCDSDPFEYVKFYQNKRDDDSLYCNSTGTFVDHPQDGGRSKPRHLSSINLIKLESFDDDEDRFQGQNQLKKESLIIGSQALRALARKSTERHSSIHTSTATLELGGTSLTNHIEEDETVAESPRPILLQQQRSDASSMYIGRLGGAFTACENLAEEETLSNPPIASNPSSPIERHSMPSIFVGNRFNHSKNTEVYVPSWRDRQELIQKQSVEEDVHSSSLDLPAACLTAPDKLQAELLYNNNNNVSSLGEDNSTIKPNPSTNRSSSSSSELCIDTNATKNRDSMRRCISYQYLQMNDKPMSTPPRQAPTPPPPPPPRRDRERDRYRDRGGDLHLDCKCRCCESSQCPSPRSSDSGMAGSCTIASPDPPNETRGHDNLLDEQHFDVCGRFREKFLTPEASQILEDEKPNEDKLEEAEETEPRTPTNRKDEEEEENDVEDCPLLPPPSPFQVYTKSIFLPSSSSVDETSHRCNNYQNDQLLFTSNSSDQLDSVAPVVPSPGPVFRSGMYAHWWKKERLPPEVVRGIVHAYKKSKDSSSMDSKNSICSSCFCSLDVASGYSEGALYCSICQNCCSGCSIGSNTTNTTTATTATSSSSTSGFCPLCSEDEDCDNVGASGGRLSNSIDCSLCAAREEDVTANGPQSAYATRQQPSTAATKLAASNCRRREQPTTAAAAAIGGGSQHQQLDVTTQTEPVLQSSPQLQSIQHAHSASTTSNASTTTTKSTKSSGNTKPQIKFSPDTKQQDSSTTAISNHGRQSSGGSSSSNGPSGGAKRKERKHKG
ncbi:uncharacterized protein LOC6643737 isoform X1 [Drosophila willistoni]|uniref:uncharacterized protein LOC6643737 isoform X1 n=1 Tax=Drosophila willistoni TaxID=7260 RepID=UPI001F07FCE7|nr:uncharacterized protein LOC6643737 isoform X1 [Drosophila willistoni]XP_046867047.1 uncharacterized protein LOC6643737 isoform X1 [Drosophila willistoni]